MRQIIGKVLYRSIAVRMPNSFAKFSFGSRRVRAFCGKLILARCGENVNIEKGAQFDETVELGDNSGIGINARLSGKVIIGNNVMMGEDCMIFTRNHRFLDLSVPMCQQGFSEMRPVVIEDDVWIGARVIILPGVRVGAGSVIGAGSVVTKNVEQYSVVVGNPARVIKWRKTQ